jgi:hypothetical protein
MLFSKSFKVFGQSIKGEIHDAKVSTGEKISQSLDHMERKVMRGVYHTVDDISNMKKTFMEGRAKYFDDESNIGEIIDGTFVVKE